MSEETKKAPAIRFQGFTDDWEQRKLGEVIDNQYNGQTPSRTNASFWNGEINWLSSGELNRGVVSETIEKITEDGRKNANLKIVPKGTFVMAITGLEAAGTRGNCAKLGIDTTMNQSCMALFPKKKLLDSSFLFQWYRKVGEEYGLQYTQGTKQQSYNAELLKILPIVLPSVSEQVLIADFFDKIDDTIALHQRKLTLFNQLKETYLKQMFPQNEENMPVLRFADFSEPWEQRKLGDTVQITMGQSPNGENYTDNPRDHILVQGNADMKNGRVCPRVWTTQVTKKADPEDIILSVRAPVGDVGRTDYTVVLGRGVAGIKGNAFIFQTLSRMKEQGFWTRYSSGSTFESINSADLKDAFIQICHIEEQTKIGDFFTKLDDTIALHQSKLQKLAELKKTLLAKMLV
ncbi:restriction endonuclease type i hsds [Trichococcus flocculiformis]|uniref:Restriction endonuclease type i hsds n=1 Tax=Trichococcus flocculiformis TaxID=82803 RepID=A0AB38BGM9_9LACT|nr:restriction endonuclease subunit S [Trichococcus flocculiformis]SBO15694.1 restriction endonuclease type i hsds [Trichococcus flocculiformis]SFH67165.1 type I restriction enzyme, S subunit [Trichococcus flocculiformis]